MECRSLYPPLLDRLREAHKQGAWISSFGTGSFLLAAAGAALAGREPM